MKNDLSNYFDSATGSINSEQNHDDSKKRREKSHSAIDIALLVTQIIELILQAVSTVAAVWALLSL